jgi:hypothetical protein
MKVKYQIASLGAIALALFAASASTFAVEQATPAYPGNYAQQARQAKEVTYDGTLVSVSGNTLTLAGSDKKERSFTVPTDVKLTLDEKASTIQDLKAGTKIRVSTHANDERAATFVEAIAKNEMFANTHQGELVSVVGSKLTMKGKDGKEHSHMLSEDAKMTLDGKTCQAQDLKAGMDIRVTTIRTDEKVANCIEAIDKDGKFAMLR